LIKRVLFYSLIFFVTCYTQDPSSSAGTSSVLLLRFGHSARAAGLSEAFTGLANDENALYYNPAGLANINEGIITLNHAEWFADIHISNISFGYNYKKNFGLAFGFTHMWMPGLEAKDIDGRDLGLFHVNTSIVNVGCAYKFHSSFFGGIGIKYFQDNPHSDISASGLALDAGFYLHSAIPGLTAGIAVQNFGGDIQYIQEKQQIPLTYRLGVAYKIYDYNLTILTDAVKARDTDFFFNLGFEYVLKEIITLRLGNKFIRGKLFTPSYGLGFTLNNYQVNYTLFYHNMLGFTHRVGFTFNFSIPARVKIPSKYLSQPGTQLIPPRNFKVKVKANELVLSWDRIAGARYNVYAKYAEGGDWKKINDDPISGTELKFKKPIIKGEYIFRVSSFINGKESYYSKEVKINVK
jgi:hypothetical protein